MNEPYGVQRVMIVDELFPGVRGSCLFSRASRGNEAIVANQAADIVNSLKIVLAQCGQEAPRQGRSCAWRLQVSSQSIIK